jgi:hypothetical protein
VGLLAVLIAFALGCAVARAGTSHVDGISDQSLPAWEGSFATSPFASMFRARWAARPRGQITLARYVVQWDSMGQDSGGANPNGNYRERFEAWLADTRSLGLTPVVALTSYDQAYPGSPGEYRARLEQILARAAATGYPIAYVEPWNEPNNQGHTTASTAAAFANAAYAACEELRRCGVIAGDFEDRSSVVTYEREYARALSFSPSIWGVHPYVSVRAHNESNLRRLIANLPTGAAAAEIWFTEIGALYCVHGEVRGEARQASDASFLLETLLRDPAVAPEHVFYYGFLFAGHRQAPCAAGAGDDSELYASTGRPRAAAGLLLLPQSAGAPPSPAAEARGAGLSAAFQLIDPFPSSMGGP